MTYKELEDLVYNYKTYSEFGFIQEEIDTLIKRFPKFNMDKFNEAMGGNTCMTCEYKGKQELVNFRCDVLLGLNCGIGDGRDVKPYEFD